MNSFIMVEYLPNNYGLAAGLGNCGGAFAITFWSWTSLLILNPENYKPSFKIKEYEREVYYFGTEITSRFTTYCLTISIIAFCGILLPVM